MSSNSDHCYMIVLRVLYFEQLEYYFGPQASFDFGLYFILYSLINFAPVYP